MKTKMFLNCKLRISEDASPSDITIMYAIKVTLKICRYSPVLNAQGLAGSAMILNSALTSR